ncbi:MAG TPA: P63C domain-containing protein [Polyangiaceae bacterium]|jgi:hypothetical protein
MTDREKDETKVKAALARADALSPQRRRAIAAKAAAARWGAKPLRATHKGNFEEEFGIDADCFVLDDDQKTAVISQRGMGAALGMSEGGSKLTSFLKGQKIAPYVGRQLAEKLANPLIFQWSAAGADVPSVVANGYDVTVLTDLCKAIIAADAGGTLVMQQAHIAKQAHIIVSAAANLGIRDLVYALAGYDQTRAEVIAAFKDFVRTEAREYEKEFPDQLYEAWIRLYDLRKPQRGKSWKHKDLTVKHVYTPLARSNGRILELAKIQKSQSPDRAAKLHQFLSELGVKALRTHLGRLLGMAEVSETRAQYEGYVEKIFGKQLSLDLTVLTVPSTAP